MFKIITTKKYWELKKQLALTEYELNHYKKQADFLREKLNQLTKNSLHRNPKTGRFEKVKEVEL